MLSRFLALTAAWLMVMLRLAFWHGTRCRAMKVGWCTLEWMFQIKEELAIAEPDGGLSSRGGDGEDGGEQDTMLSSAIIVRAGLTRARRLDGCARALRHLVTESEVK